MILLLDNYDSFVFNLDRYFQELGATTQVIRNDAVSVNEIERLQPAAIVISPGPCTPNEAGISLELIRQLGPQIPILGVCLGHQAIGQVFGGEVVRAPEPVHGRTSLIRHQERGLFEGLPSPFAAMRYHSLIVRESTLPSEVVVTATTLDGIPMALQHRFWPIYGVQFHPESVLTQGGHQLLCNFLRLAGLEPGDGPREEFPALQTVADWHASEIDDVPFRPF